MSQPIQKTEQNPNSYFPKEKPVILSMAAHDAKPTTVEELQVYVSNNGEPPKNSNKIKGIRRLWYDNKGENYYLEGCFTAVMKAIGESPDYDFVFFTVAGGSIFTQVYRGGTAGLASVLDHRIMPHIFKQCGYSYIYVDNKTIKNHYELVVDVIKTAIDKGIPVMSSGFGNIQLGSNTVNHREWCNIGGYDTEDTFYVNVFPEDAVVEENGYCTVKSGLIGSDGLYILHKKLYTPVISDIYRQAIFSIPAFITLPSFNGISLGQQAFYDWADNMLKNENFENLSENPFEGFLWEGHHAPWINAWTNEVYMRVCFDKVIAECGLPQAIKVKEIYAKIYADLPQIQKLHGGDFFAANNIINKPDVRKSIASILRNMGDVHNELFELFV